MEGFASEAEYLEALGRRAVLPAGFRVSTGRLTFTPHERPTQEPYRMNLSLLLADEPTAVFGAVLTRNAFPGAPIHLARKRLLLRRVPLAGGCEDVLERFLSLTIGDITRSLAALE